MYSREEIKELRRKLERTPKVELLEIASHCGITEEKLEMLLDIFVFKRQAQAISRKYNMSVETVAATKRKMLECICNYYRFLERKRA